MPPSSPSLMVWLAVFDTVYLSSALVIFSIPILWPEISVTKVFTHLITVLLPTAHIGLNGEIIRVKLNKFMIILPEIIIIRISLKNNLFMVHVNH